VRGTEAVNLFLGEVYLFLGEVYSQRLSGSEESTRAARIVPFKAQN
jgi:hypothetical protein